MRLPHHDRLADAVWKFVGCYRFCWTTRSNVSQVVWSEPNMDKFEPGCFVRTVGHESGMPSDRLARIQNL